MIDSRISLVMFTVMFTVLVSFMATAFNIESVNCSDPTDLISEPGEDPTSVDKLISLLNGIVDVFFGCSSSNPLINGVFLALQASIIIVLLVIAKDLVPLT